MFWIKNKKKTFGEMGSFIETRKIRQTVGNTLVQNFIYFFYYFICVCVCVGGGGHFIGHSVIQS